MNQFREEEPDTEPVKDALTTARLAAAKQRLQENSTINKNKSTFMFMAFYCVALSFYANVATLIMRLF